MGAGFGFLFNEGRSSIRTEIFCFFHFFSRFFKSIISERMKSTIDFFPVIKTRLVGVTEMTQTRLGGVADLS